MTGQIIKLLEKHEDEIMKYTLGDSVDEFGKRYAEVYTFEWDAHKCNVAYTIDKIKKYNKNVSATGFAYIIISEWCGVMVFRDGDLNMVELVGVCQRILAELE